MENTTMINEAVVEETGVVVEEAAKSFKGLKIACGIGTAIGVVVGGGFLVRKLIKDHKAKHALDDEVFESEKTAEEDFKVVEDVEE